MVRASTATAGRGRPPSVYRAGAAAPPLLDLRPALGAELGGGGDLGAALGAELAPPRSPPSTALLAGADLAGGVAVASAPASSAGAAALGGALHGGGGAGALAAVRHRLVDLRQHLPHAHRRTPAAGSCRRRPPRSTPRRRRWRRCPGR